MTMDRQKGQIVFMCDDCEQVIETGRADFTEALFIMRRQGWRSRKDDDDSDEGDWRHYCGDCGGGL